MGPVLELWGSFRPIGDLGAWWGAAINPVMVQEPAYPDTKLSVCGSIFDSKTKLVGLYGMEPAATSGGSLLWVFLGPDPS